MGKFPLGAKKIGRLWPIEEGGFGVTACTDATGQPIIGIYPLKPNGQPAGQEILYAHQRLMIRIVIGHDVRAKAIVVFADIEVTPQGMGLRVLMPQWLMARGYDSHLLARWGSPAPRLNEAPVNSNWPNPPSLIAINSQ